jgi:hypothetical protein
MIFDANCKVLETGINKSEIDIYQMSIEELIHYRNSFSTSQDRGSEIYNTFKVFIIQIRVI